SGCWASVWVPSLAQDLRVVGDVANGATTLDVAWAGFSAAAPAENRRDVRITLRDGTQLFRRITGAVEHSASVERLTVDSAIATGFSAADVAQVAFLQLCRQEADVNVLRWWTAEVVRTTLEFRGEARHGLYPVRALASPGPQHGAVHRRAPAAGGPEQPQRPQAAHCDGRVPH